MGLSDRLEVIESMFLGIVKPLVSFLFLFPNLIISWTVLSHVPAMIFLKLSPIGDWKAADQVWTQSSNTERQSKYCLFFKLIISGICYNNRKLLAHNHTRKILFLFPWENVLSESFSHLLKLTLLVRCKYGKNTGLWIHIQCPLFYFILSDNDNLLWIFWKMTQLKKWLHSPSALLSG